MVIFVVALLCRVFCACLHIVINMNYTSPSASHEHAGQSVSTRFIGNIVRDATIVEVMCVLPSGTAQNAISVFLQLLPLYVQ